MNSTDQNASESPKPTYRSRTGRFSPSMGWKAFWSEIVIVILGVLIALAANEAVQNWSWQNKVRDGEIRLKQDTEFTFYSLTEQMAVAPCVDAQLAGLTRILMDSNIKLNTVPIFSETNRRYVVRMPERPFAFPVWQSMVADGTASHFTDKRQSVFGNLSDRLTLMQFGNREVNRLSERLLIMGYPLLLQSGERREILLDIEGLRSRAVREASSAEQLMSLMLELKIEPNAESVNQFLKESGTVKFCKAHGYPLADWRSYKTK